MAVTKPGYINSYVGFPSFFGAPIIGREEVKEGMTVVAGVPIDEGINIGRKGARFGPRGIREGTYKYRMVQEMAEDRTTVDLDSHMGFRFKGDGLLADIGDLDISPQDIMVTTEGVASGVSDIVRRGGVAGNPWRRPLRLLPGLSRVCEGDDGETVESPDRVLAHRQPPRFLG